MTTNECTAAGFIIYRVRNKKPEILGLIARHNFQIESNGKYDIPKGQRDLGETPFACALRECKEETGMLPNLPIAGPYEHGRLSLWLSECDTTPVIQVNPHTGELEHLGYEWLEPDIIISNCLDYLEKPLKWAKETLCKHL